MDHEDFLHAIRADPDDDGPRLVYSDWLQEQGDPRGEFVLAQCRVAEAADGPGGLDWVAREAEFLERHFDEWTEPLRRCGAEQIVFRRGFVDEFKIPGELLPAFDDLVLLAPLVTHLRVRSAHRGFPFDFASEAFRQLAALTMRVGTLGPAAAAQLAGAETLCNLRRLDLNGNRLGDRGVESLVARPGLARLEFLSLGSNELGPHSVELLEGAPFVPSLKQLVLTANAVGGGLRRLGRDSTLDGLESLDLTQCNVGRLVARRVRRRLGNRCRL